MRDRIPLKINNIECGIINLDDYEGAGTHWTSYIKCQNSVFYFDSFGHLQPPKEVVKYFLSDGSISRIFYNYDVYQKFNQFNCGHLCIIFLYNNIQRIC